jgi:hypothetical protein
VRFHGKRFAWFVSDVTRKDWDWLLNSMMYGSLFPDGSDAELASLKQLATRWKGYENEGQWIYEQHPFWCTGYSFWSLPSEAPDLFLHLSESDCVYFKGDLNHRCVADEASWCGIADPLAPTASSRTTARRRRRRPSTLPLARSPARTVRRRSCRCARSSPT